MDSTVARPTLLRTADPYRDLDVVDARAPRFLQATVGIGSLIAVVTGWWVILALLAAQLAIGLRFGRRYCLPCVAYFEWVQPRIGEGPIEDARPPRFANWIGFGVLTTASVAYAVGWTGLGVALGVLVAFLALLAAVTGFCTGCQIYRLGARLRGIRGHELDRIEPADLEALVGPMRAAGTAGVGNLVVAFSHPLCTECRELESHLRADDRPFVRIDVRERPDLARKYGIALVPTVVEVTPNGAIVK
jgi:Domain of unknown function (DUF4395)